MHPPRHATVCCQVPWTRMGLTGKVRRGRPRSILLCLRRLRERFRTAACCALRGRAVPRAAPLEGLGPPAAAGTRANAPSGSAACCCCSCAVRASDARISASRRASSAASAVFNRAAPDAARAASLLCAACKRAWASLMRLEESRPPVAATRAAAPDLPLPEPAVARASPATNATALSTSLWR